MEMPPKSRRRDGGAYETAILKTTAPTPHVVMRILDRFRERYLMPDKGSRAFGARGLIVLAVMLGLGLSARPAAAQQPYVYVANFGSNPGTVSVIDTATNTPLTGPGFPIPVGNGPKGIAVTPDGTHVIVANQLSSTVSVIDMTASPPSVATIPLVAGSAPSRVAITPNGYAYVANNGSDPGTVSVINIATNTPLTGPGFPIPVGSFPFAVAITPNGQFAYVTNDGSRSVSVINTATNTPLTGPGFPIPVGTIPLGIAITPNGQFAYVANNGSDPGTVSVINTTTNPPTVVATVPVGTPSGVAITPEGTQVYVTNQLSDTVSVINATNNTPLTGPGFPIQVGRSPSAVAITPNGQFAYVANNGSDPGTVSVIDTTTNPPTVVATVPVGNSPADVGIASGVPQCVARRFCAGSSPLLQVGCLSAVIFEHTVDCSSPSTTSITCPMTFQNILPLLACNPTTNSCTGFSRSEERNPCAPPPIANCGQCEALNGQCEFENGKFIGCLHPQ
jgi:YVTN family beta-propeller protein